MLLHAGADLSIEETREHKTPYQLAVQFQELEIMDTLKKVEGKYLPLTTIYNSRSVEMAAEARPQGAPTSFRQTGYVHTRASAGSRKCKYYS